MSHDQSSRAAITRRDFVRTTALTSAGALALGRVATARPRAMDTIQVGIIGCGGRGTGAVMQALKADTNAQLTAMADAFPERIETCRDYLMQNEAIADRVAVQEADCYAGFDGYKELIDSGVDMVILTTPPVFRPMHLEYAISRGKHVFCEKPVAVDAPGIRSVLATTAEAKRRNLALMSGFCWRYNFPQRETYGRIHDGQIGDVTAIHTTYNTGPLGDVARDPSWSDTEWQLRNWKAFTWSSGDHIVEQAIHAIDWIHWALQGELPTRAYAVGGRQCRTGAWTGNLYDHFSVVYEFASGARGFHMCRQIPDCTNDNSAYIMGTKGTCKSNPWAPNSIVMTGEQPWRYTGPNNDMYQTEHDELFASIRAGTPINDGVHMAHSTMMGIMGRMCAYTGEALTWDQCMASQEDLTPATWEWGDRPFPPVAMPSERQYR
ncbi:MAG: Gfo/Idh/MocA family oxidoreductase [Phycisphaerales bacterium]|nr:Gfo/Idh/MocA family oxidoreductase [Phycisphaerales bacterium]